ncbi:G-type lectin S-receptor-like serine/threonine-protein kinase At4g27290 isoform X2 [Malania oleifera]|uniref:G-type lectin S-receptor-like serine/threonine-protein kinase At4g27290 isoform X2 n=1 Tax=Malania oleifera TaxID=397392 RepID=UPI0025AE0EC9|nr:G-type lectin S-receptor-like serine/threonine-protein kinase At4g27290 isoform X2 [Malania oleifera]
MDIICSLFVSIELLYVLPKISYAADTISASQPLSDGRTLISKQGSFELGFFSPGDSGEKYVGIWYKNIPVKTVVWVANRDKPINGSAGALMINTAGSLILHDQNGSIVWSSNASSLKLPQNPVLQLLDSGNLVLRNEKDDNSESYLWQSFDYPSDTLLPGMKLGSDLSTGLNRQLSSWKNPDDPSAGEFTYRIDLYSYPDAAVWKLSSKYFRCGPWNGLRFSGVPELKPNPVFEFSFKSNQEEVYFTYDLKNKSMVSRLVLNQTSSSIERYVWIEDEQFWKLYASTPKDNCDVYGLCGAHGTCVISESPICQCLEKFKPKSPEKWNIMDWSEGCIRNTPLNCGNTDGFNKFTGLKLPDSANTWVNESMTLEECRAKCLKNCSCMAYTNADIRGGGSGCVMWFDDLTDMRQLAANGQDLYIRMPASELERRENSGEAGNEDLELPLLDLATVTSSTNNFSDDSKLGEGGFGPVYKGTLADGQEIAVKRLSKNSGQGLKEFKNEVILIAKLQHRNLVRLLGCCIQGEEKMLVYEYLPNKSLDSFIFDQTKCKRLDWNRRFHIICGIARGLLYLHQDSRLRIIHRDLKASNVLLDHEMNPKISDFGMARPFGGDQTEGNTNKVVGTFGYMAPEYAVDGLFSIKSDVFSFGVLLLEIVTGKKNRGFFHPNHSLNLLGHAWTLWKEERPLELIDGLYEDSSSLFEVLRCIHIGLLCVQQHPEDRPIMSYVVLMLGSDGALPQPKQPGFFINRNPLEEVDSSSSKNKSYSANEISVTLLNAR